MYVSRTVIFTPSLYSFACTDFLYFIRPQLALCFIFRDSNNSDHHWGCTPVQCESVNLPDASAVRAHSFIPATHVSRHLHIQTLEIDLLPVCYFPILSVPLLFLIFCFYVLTGCDLAADLREEKRY